MVEWLQHISLPLILGIVKMSSRIEFPGFFSFLLKDLLGPCSNIQLLLFHYSSTLEFSNIAAYLE